MIEFRSISAGYKNAPVLEALSLTAHTGELTVLVGENGCGKSTLLKSAVGVVPRTGGKLFLDGTDADTLERTALARRMAYLPQSTQIPDMTVFELVLHGRFPHLGYPRIYRAADRTIARTALERVGIADLADRPLATLSGGMLQSAYFAMALAQESDTVLLDEPTAHLDVSHAAELMHLLRRLTHTHQKTVLAVLHDLPLAFGFADRVAVLHGGRIVACQAPHELLDHPCIREIFGVTLGYDREDGTYYVKGLRAQK